MQLDQKDLEIAPIERAFTIPAEWYTEKDPWDIDRSIHKDHWQFIGHVSQIPASGDYLSATVVGEPVVVVRQKDGSVKGFFNVCRHRGGPVAMKPCGHANMLQCKYHGWTYRLDGSLRGVPKFDRSELFDKRDYGLTPINVRVWQGLIFLGLSESCPPIESVVAGISQMIEPIDLKELTHARRVTYDVNCNWKVYIDNFLEGYHVPLVHPELCDMIEMKEYVTETYNYYSVQYSPLKTQGYSSEPASGDGRAMYFFVYPNFMLNVLPGRLQTNVVEATSPRTCRVHFDFYYVPGTPPTKIEDDVVASDKIQQEDIEICERVFEGLRSSSYRVGRFSPDAEQGVYHFQSLLRKSYARFG